MLLAARQRRAGNIRGGVLANKAYGHLIARERGSHRNLECIVARIRADIGDPGVQVNRFKGFTLQLDVMNRGFRAQGHRGHRIALNAGAPKRTEALEHGRRRTVLGHKNVARIDRSRCIRAVEMDEMDRLLERHTFRQTQCHSARHQRGVQRDQNVVAASRRGVETRHEPFRRRFQHLG